MERRTFLGLWTAAAGALAVPAATLRFDQAARPWHIEGEAVFPGAPLHVTLTEDVPEGCQVKLRVVSGSQDYPCGAFPAPPSARLHLATPFPHQDLVAGSYTVHIDLVSHRGALLDTLVAGTYRLRRFRFSA